MIGIFRNLFNYRELLKNNIKKEIRGKYKKSFLGIMWSFINPLLQIAVYALVFPLILKIKQENYVIFLCTGLIPWTFFSTAISRSASTIIENGNIVKKVYFPREILPISIISAETVNFLISSLIILLFVIFGGMGISKYIVFYPIILIIQYLLLVGVSLIISSITVFFRDLQHLIGISLQLLFYATPIVYAAETIPQEFSWIIKLNPMTYVINGYRDIFYNQVMPDIKGIGIIFIMTLLLLVLGYGLFNKLQKGFAEEL